MVRLILHSLQKSLTAGNNVAREESEMIIDFAFEEHHSGWIFAGGGIEQPRAHPRGGRSGKRVVLPKVVFVCDTNSAHGEIVAGVEYIGRQHERHGLIAGQQSEVVELIAVLGS